MKKNTIKKKSSVKKYEQGGPVEPEPKGDGQMSAPTRRKTKTKVYSDDGNYVKKTVTRPNLFGSGSTTKEKTRRTVQGFFNSAPSASKMSQFGSEYKNLETQKRGGTVGKSRKRK